MSKYFKIFVYSSLIFLGWYLWHHGLLKIPRIRSYSLLSLSALPLLAGFLGSSLAWSKILNKSGFSIQFAESIASMGLSIFGKYIPGKVWMIVGRAAYAAERRQYPISSLSVISLNDQCISLWTGLLMGTLGLFAIDSLHLYKWPVLTSWLTLSLIIFIPQVRGVVEKCFRLFLRKRISLPTLKVKETAAIIPWFFGYWTLWSTAFYLLVSGLFDPNPSCALGLAFPLAGSLGIMALIAPGGLGIREGVMAAYLNSAGIPLADAAAISIASRLWFLIGEAAFFLLGIFAHRIVSRQDRKP